MLLPGCSHSTWDPCNTGICHLPTHVAPHLAPYLVVPQGVQQGVLSLHKGCSGRGHGLPRPIALSETPGSPKIPTKAHPSCNNSAITPFVSKPTKILPQLTG